MLIHPHSEEKLRRRNIRTPEYRQEFFFFFFKFKVFLSPKIQVTKDQGTKRIRGNECTAPPKGDTAGGESGTLSFIWRMTR